MCVCVCLCLFVSFIMEYFFGGYCLSKDLEIGKGEVFCE